jgi:hypothetical protein
MTWVVQMTWHQETVMALHFVEDSPQTQQEVPNQLMDDFQTV